LLYKLLKMSQNNISGNKSYKTSEIGDWLVKEIL